MPQFPDRLRQLRLVAGLTQEQLGFAVEVTKSSVSAWENGRETLSFRSLSLLRDALGCSLDTLILGESGDETAVADKSSDVRARDFNEQRLLAAYRRMGPRQRRALLELLESWGQAEAISDGFQPVE